MSFICFDMVIRKASVIGSGNIGPDIAIHLSQNLAPHGVPLVVVGRRQVSLDRAAKRIEAKVNKAAQKGLLTKEQAKSTFGNMSFTTDYGELSDVDFIIEAGPERLDVKHSIFAQCEEICSQSTILASNSSHIIPEAIFQNINDKSRCLVIHHFFPAERNILVEMVASKETDPALFQQLLWFYEYLGKAPIKVKSQYGFAVNPVFGAFFLSSILAVEKGLASVKETEAIASKALGLGIGPFTTHNLSGGNPLSQYCLPIFGKEIIPWYHSPKLLDEMVETGDPWDVPQRGEKVEYSVEAYETVSKRVLGAYFGVASKMVENGVATIGDLDLAMEYGLDIIPPFRMMNQMGVKKALEIVRDYAEENQGFVVSETLVNQAVADKPWKIPVVFREDMGNVAAIKIRRPKMLNALNDEVLKQLEEVFIDIKEDEGIVGAVLTGFGTKAFVSGADIGMLAALKTPTEAEALSHRGHVVTDLIENLGKPTVCAMNGLAFGGGIELAMACTARIAMKGLEAFAALPEPLLGIIPANGGTQRLPRLVGVENALHVLRSAQPISSSRSLEIGLINAEVEGNLIAEGVELVKNLCLGDVSFYPIEKGPITIPSKLPEVDIGHLSLKVDSLLKDAVLGGAKMNLEDGLKLEAKIFGECFLTQDMRIGIENFINEGPKVKARFIHK